MLLIFLGEMGLLAQDHFIVFIAEQDNDAAVEKIEPIPLADRAERDQSFIPGRFGMQPAAAGGTKFKMHGIASFVDTELAYPTG